MINEDQKKSKPMIKISSYIYIERASFYIL